MNMFIYYTLFTRRTSMYIHLALKCKVKNLSNLKLLQIAADGL